MWDTSAWEVIKCAFPENHHQSRVMTTTRIRSVAAACCNYNYEDIYNMKALTDQDAKRLFFNRIFGSGGTCPPHFKSVSTEILKKCGGMPLAIITIASLLASQPNNLKEQWEYIRNSLGTSHGENPTLDGMRKILNLSYTNLPHCIKACFLYVGIYPEDFTIKKDDLIKLWVAEGFVRTAHNDHDAYCVARGYFNELINRSMIQPILLDHNDDVLTCRVHDMILDLIISKSTDENLFTIVNDSKFMRRLCGKVRRLSFHSWINMEKYNKIVATICLSQARSLVMLSYGFIPNVLDFRSLQVLILENSDQQDLTGICTLTQLRYFKIRTMEQFKLPSQIRGLQHLETFEIEKVPHFGFNSLHHLDIILPSDIIHLPRLLHLIIPDPKIMPDGIGNLKNLQTLKYFDLGTNSLHNIASLQELTNLKDLHLSCSRGSSFVGYKDVLFQYLARLADCNLKDLHINHHLSTMCCDSLNGLFKSAHHLQRLFFSDWQFSRVPSWIGELNVLHRLELSLGKLLKDDILILAEMPSLAHLYLHVRSAAKERIVISGTTFIVLKHFKLICKRIPLTFEAGTNGVTFWHRAFVKPQTNPCKHQWIPCYSVR